MGTSTYCSHAHAFTKLHRPHRSDYSENLLCTHCTGHAGRRFPRDFMFQLSPNELRNLRFQIGTSRRAQGGRRYAPYAFTEQGIAMLSSVLRSARAIQVNVAIMRTFVRLREMLATHEELRRKIDAMEKRYDARFQAVFATIRQMLETPLPAKKPIGFHAKLELAAKSRQINQRMHK